MGSAIFGSKSTYLQEETRETETTSAPAAPVAPGVPAESAAHTTYTCVSSDGRAAARARELMDTLEDPVGVFTSAVEELIDLFEVVLNVALVSL